MQGHISKLHCRYRVIGDKGCVPSVQGRLDRLIETHVVSSYENALQQVYSDDTQVIIIRHITSSLILSLNDAQDSRIARQWGEVMAKEVVKRIDDAVLTPGNVIKFDNQASYIAHFIEDVLKGHAWEKWYYGYFRRYQYKNQAETIYHLLQEHQSEVSYVLGALYQKGLLPTFIKCLPDTALSAVWAMGKPSISSEFSYLQQLSLDEALALMRSFAKSGAIEWPVSTPNDAFFAKLAQLLAAMPWVDFDYFKSVLLNYLAGKPYASDALKIFTPVGDGEKVRELFVQVCNIVERLKLWSQEGMSMDSMLSGYPLDTWVDWQDTDTLTRAVQDMLRYLATKGNLKILTGSLPVEFLQDLKSVLADYDWLNVIQLQETLLELVSGTAANGEPLRLTPRQQELLENVTQLLKEIALPKEYLQEYLNDGNVSKLAIHLYAALVNRYPRWAGDELTTRLIESLVNVLKAFTAEIPPSSWKQFLASGWNSAQLDGPLTVTVSTETKRSLAFIGRLGSKAAALVEILLEDTLRRESRVIDTESVTSNCAGLFLLIRAINDLGLQRLMNAAQFNQDSESIDVSHVITAALLRLSGEAYQSDETIDPGLNLLLKDQQLLTLGQLRQIWQKVSEPQLEKLQWELLRSLVKQRVLKGSQLSIYTITLPKIPGFDDEETKLLVAGDDEAILWPVALVLQSWDDAVAAVVALVTHWIKITGCSPETLVVSDELAIQMEGKQTNDGLPFVNTAQTDGQVGDAIRLSVQGYEEGREQLLESLKYLHSSRLGPAQVDMTIATLAMAILKMWARWLPRVSNSSAVYLLKNMLQRRGEIVQDKNTLSVVLEPAPLDVVLEMAGYLDEIESVACLGGRSLRFRVRK